MRYVCHEDGHNVFLFTKTKPEKIVITYSIANPDITKYNIVSQKISILW